MKNLLILGLALTLAGCGGYHKAKRDSGRSAPRSISGPIAITPSASTTVISAPASKPFANGPLQKACISSDRKARNSQLCGCIQAVANRTLNSSQQARAVGFYRDPHSAQEVRTSDRPGDERFWETYASYAETAKRTCS
ncbi:hypothetical protein ACM25N_01680 [Roseovarius sp. C7]|uniref:hypothetical protein n=1 Tax=Roseovarius sp. C7 TaxID=3398643 RepID=UPI0039F60E00